MHGRKDKPLLHSNCASQLFLHTLYKVLLGLPLLSFLASWQVLLVLHWLEWKQAVWTLDQLQVGRGQILEVRSLGAEEDL